MIRSPTPTRAEASDVATAVYEGADAVMLSGETAAGDYPVEAVKMMEDITESVERDPLYRTILDAVLVTPETTPSDAITAATRKVAETISAAVIVTFTTSGSTTLRATRERPSTPILALTPKRTTARNLTLAWGVHSLQVGDFHHFDDMIGEAVRRANEVGLVQPGDRLVLTAGLPLGVPGMTNVLRIVVVDASGSATRRSSGRGSLSPMLAELFSIIAPLFVCAGIGYGWAKTGRRLRRRNGDQPGHQHRRALPGVSYPHQSQGSGGVVRHDGGRGGRGHRSFASSSAA